MNLNAHERDLEKKKEDGHRNKTIYSYKIIQKRRTNIRQRPTYIDIYIGKRPISKQRRRNKYERDLYILVCIEKQRPYPCQNEPKCTRERLKYRRCIYRKEICI